MHKKLLKNKFCAYKKYMGFFKRNKKVIIGSVSVLAIAMIITGTLASQAYSSKIAKNVIVGGVNIGNLTKQEAINKLQKESKFKNIDLEYGDKKWSIPEDEINLKIDFDKTVDAAYDYNKGNGFFTDISRTLKSDMGSKKTVSLSMDYNRDALSKKLNSIKEELDSPIKNATLNVVDGEVKVIPEESGRNMNVETSLNKTAENLRKNIFKTELVVKLSPAKFTKNELKGIDTLLGSYETTFGGMPNRDYNIKKSTVDSGGIILKPGQEYSFNGITGEKTIANGYKNAPVIESGQLVLGTGGGVCQTSSTIFNAALLSGMEITSRRNHTIPSDYVQLGRDATVVDGEHGQDFRFKNPFKHPVYVKNFVSGNTIGSQIYGFKEDKQNIKIVTEMLGSFGGGNKTVPDPKLPSGKKVVEKYGRPGYNVATYRVYTDDSGKRIKTEKVATSTYPAQTGIVRVGAGAATQKTNLKKTNLSGQTATAAKPTVHSGAQKTSIHQNTVR